MIEDTLKGLQQAEYVHVVLNHLPVVGLAAGLLVLIIAIVQKSRATSVAAYVVILLMSLSVYPVSEYGEKAVDQVESLLDEPGRIWLRKHGQRAEKVTWLYYTTAIFAVSGLFLPRFVGKSAPVLLWGTTLFGIAALAGGVWVASAGGKIMHREFRYSLPNAESNP